MKGMVLRITTASKLNGALVLRHEIGHSLIDVGEEYEGGYAYFGANSADNLTAVVRHTVKSDHTRCRP